MVIGVGKQIMNELPFMHISMAEVPHTSRLSLLYSTDTCSQVDLKFINRYHHSWPVAIRLLQHGVLDLKPLVTHRFPLEKAVDALKASADRNSGSIKIHIEDGDAQQVVTGRVVSKL
jgi:L-iditol 2-dehydrogenase